MAAGRKPTPTALKALRGNPGKRRLNASEPKPSGIPTCPKHLTKAAKSEWNRISKELLVLGLLTSVDRAALAAYCSAYARWADAETKIQELGAVTTTDKGNIIQSPWVGCANRAMELMHKFLTEFGLTPSSRSRLQVQVPPDKQDEVWDALLNGAELPAVPIQPQGNA
jgi:P27 family predicted phage terminase small subunit